MKRLVIMLLFFGSVLLTGCIHNPYSADDLSDYPNSEWHSTSPEMTLNVDEEGRISGVMSIEGKKVDIKVDFSTTTYSFTPVSESEKKKNNIKYGTDEYIQTLEYSMSNKEVVFSNMSIDNAYWNQYAEIQLERVK